MPSLGPPGPCNVPRNRWDLVETAAAAHPGAAVSIVVTAIAATDAGPLAETLAAGSGGRAVELLLPAGTGVPASLRQPEGIEIASVDTPVDGGETAYRNAAAKSASHEVLLFIDADAVPDSSLIDAHARWHETASDLVVTGRTIAADGEVPAWISGHRLRTRNLTVDGSDLFRFFPVTNVSLRRQTLLRAGGFSLGEDPDLREDEVLGYRLHQSGAVFAFDEGAVCRVARDRWPARRPSRTPVDAAWIAQRVPHPSTRRPTSGRSYLVPRWEVLIDASGADMTDVAVSVESVLGANTHDLVIRLAGLEEKETARWAGESFGSDARVRTDDAEDTWTPLRLQMPAGAVQRPDSLGALEAAFAASQDPADVLRVTIPGLPPNDASVVAFTRRAWHRGARISPDDPLSAAGNVCGQRWVSGSQVGLAWRQVEVADDQPAIDAGATGIDPEQFRSLWDAMEALSEGERRAVLRVGQRLLGGPRWLRRLLVRIGRVLARA